MFHFSLSMALRQDKRIETKLALAGGYSDFALRGVGLYPPACKPYGLASGS
jgi:hypothetical protein